MGLKMCVHQFILNSLLKLSFSITLRSQCFRKEQKCLPQGIFVTVGLWTRTMTQCHCRGTSNLDPNNKLTACWLNSRKLHTWRRSVSPTPTTSVQETEKMRRGVHTCLYTCFRKHKNESGVVTHACIPDREPASAGL